MSEIRQRFRVAWDDGEPVEVTTSARDIAAIGKYLPVDKRGNVDLAHVLETDATTGFRLVHAALIRKGFDNVPSEFDTWLDLLDVCESLEGAPPVLPDPTKPRRSARRP
jgi:hypothetical protein